MQENTGAFTNSGQFRSCRRAGCRNSNAKSGREEAMPPALCAADNAADSWRITVADSPAALADAWEELAARGVGLPYQRLAWVECFCETIGRALSAEPRIALLRDHDGAPIAVLPLMRVRRRGARVLEFVGGKHANFQMPLFVPDRFAFDSREAAGAFISRLAVSAGGADVFIARNQPPAWGGVANPLAVLAGEAAPQAGYRTEIGTDFSAFLNAAMSSDSRKKLKKKRRILEAQGNLTFQRAQTGSDVEAILAAFHRQKASRLSERGVANPFDAPGASAFLRRGALANLARPRSGGIALFALRTGDRIIATFGAADDGRQLCGMFNSFEAEPELARGSPGDQVLHDLLKLLFGEGYRSFDLGVGDAPYKLTYCKDRLELSDTVLPLTPLGVLAATAYRIAARAKLVVRANPALLGLANRLHRRLAPKTASG
jgi:CelD/BcsL family acetyltransferase involved in cellulose biosynthesis